MSVSPITLSSSTSSRETVPAAAGGFSSVPPVVRLIGNTPLVELRKVTKHLPESVKVFAKAEWFNPGGSVKDRAAWWMIRAAMVQGKLENKKRLLDATSGNTGIALAMIGAALNVGVTLCIPANASVERKNLLKSYGAEVIFTDAMESTDGAQLFAKELSQNEPYLYHYLDQYSNPANWQAHYQTTGTEIWQQTQGEISHFITGLGTTGTFVGVSKFLKSKDSGIKTMTFQPDGPFHGLEGLKHLPSVHVPTIYDDSFLDGNLEISTEESYAMIKTLAKDEGLFVGVSSGAAAVAAIKLAETLDSGTVVTVFPDGGSRYQSLPIWE